MKKNLISILIISLWRIKKSDLGTRKNNSGGQNFLMIDKTQNVEEENLFVEQAEYIDGNAFLKWSIEQPDENIIIRKLSRGGAKLITGPRGCGKTTLMLKTFYKLCADEETASLPIYVNLKISLQLEPLYKKGVNAVFWFNQWLLFKVYQGLFHTLKEVKKAPSHLKFNEQFVERVTNQLELGRIDKLIDDEDYLLTIPSLEDEIKKVLILLGKTRCVLLLDDAAHIFSPEQQRDFFDFFRQIKSRIISPKAAIYPGVTLDLTRFRIGYETEEIDVWIKPDSPDYLDFMFQILERRLPYEFYNVLLANKSLLRLLCYAAFGMPRALLNMIRSFYKKNSLEPSNFNRAKVSRIINSSFANTFSVYDSFKLQRPTYERFISAGEQLFYTMINKLKKYNNGKKINSQSVSIGIKHPLPAELSKVLVFFQQAGLIISKGKSHRGDEKTFETYVIHYAALILENVLFGRKSVHTVDLSEALDRQCSSLSFTQITPKILMGTGDFSSRLELVLPPCQVCGTPRINECSKFCINCCAVLKTAPTFDEVVKNDIEKLGLANKWIQTIKMHSHIYTIKDVLMEPNNQELRGIPGIGEKLAKRIYSRAEEYIS